MIERHSELVAIEASKMADRYFASGGYRAFAKGVRARLPYAGWLSPAAEKALELRWRLFLDRT